MRCALRALVVAALAAGCFIAGCGSGLTGGSIPPGSSTRASGLVVRGDSSGTALAGAVIRFQPITSGRLTIGTGDNNPPPPPDFGGNTGGGPVIELPIAEVPGTVKVTTGEAGQFHVENLPAGPVRVIVSPPETSGLSTFIYEMDVDAAWPYYFVLAPLPNGFSSIGLTGIDVIPATVELVVGEAKQLQVQMIGGAPPPVVPSYILRGDLALISPQARITGVRVGTGSLRVVVGPYQKSVPVSVRPIG